MACGGCSKKRKGIIAQSIKSPRPKQTRNPVRMQTTNGLKPCPLCKTPMKFIHRYDKELNTVIKKYICQNAACGNK